MATMDKIPSTSTSQTVCGYSAYTLVECNISAENTAGSGEFIEFDSIYTCCEGWLWKQLSFLATFSSHSD